MSEGGFQSTIDGAGTEWSRADERDGMRALFYITGSAFFAYQ